MRTHREFRLNLLCAAVIAAIATPAAAQDGAQPAPTTLDKVSVTGSRIKRTDVETALPITVIQKEEIQAQGITSAEQMLQYLNIAGNGSDNLTAQVGVGSDEMRGNNGVSGANLRGQGADATLCCSTAAASPPTACAARRWTSIPSRSRRSTASKCCATALRRCTAPTPSAA